jgi:DUF1680 family protein
VRITRLSPVHLLPSVLLVVAALLLAAASVVRLAGREAGLPAQAAPAERVAGIPVAARPFPLQAVRLLDGPFREAMLRDQAYLLELDPDRLLHNFRVTAGLPSSAAPLGGWEAPDVELRGHTVGHYLSALALMYASTGDERFKARGDLMVAELAKVQEALAARGFNKGYLSAFPEEFIDRVEARQRVWAPYYTLHKIMAGLLDMYTLCGNRQALDVLLKKADWVKLRMDRLPREKQQAMLMTEYGGMNEVLANLYAVTGNPDHLRLARAFDHDFLFEPLARGEDPLDGLHANTQIPKIIGAAREYELTGETRYRTIASFFWERVARYRSYANGGHSDGEVFFPIDRFSQHLGAASSETCNTYNMLKLSRHLFMWQPSAEVMDFYERGLYNHILASQDPATGMMIYYCPLKPGAFRTYSTRDASFWCCVGTGLENHAKYPDTIYFHDAGTLFVNLFIPSELAWSDKGLVVRQETRFPEEEATRLTFTAKAPVPLTLRIRWPAWARSGFTVAINGTAESVTGAPGSYVAVSRTWKSGDTVEIRLPMSLRLEAMPDDPSVVAVLYGPVLLAGDLGRDGLDEARRYGPSAPPLGRLKTPVVPAFVTDRAKLLSAIRPVPGSPLTFRTSGIGQPHDVTLVPFYRAHDIRYTVYWRTYTPAEWTAHLAATAAAEAKRREIESRTIDTVDPGSDESEKAHAFQGADTSQPYFEGRRGREARRGGRDASQGWFSYELRVLPDRPVTLVCTYRGGEGRRRIFDILVDGQKIATETLAYHPTELLDVEYPIPEALTRGRTRVTVRFEPHDEAATAAVFEIRTVPHAGSQ